MPKLYSWKSSILAHDMYLGHPQRSSPCWIFALWSTEAARGGFELTSPYKNLLRMWHPCSPNSCWCWGSWLNLFSGILIFEGWLVIPGKKPLHHSCESNILTFWGWVCHIRNKFTAKSLFCWEQMTINIFLCPFIEMAWSKLYKKLVIIPLRANHTSIFLLLGVLRMWHFLFFWSSTQHWSFTYNDSLSQKAQVSALMWLSTQTASKKKLKSLL